MTTDLKVRQGTTAWFELAGTLMSQAASRAGLSPELNASFLERYTDGVELSAGLFKAFVSTSSAASRPFGLGCGRTSEQT